MRILTVKQPWAHLIIHGAKNVENRTWKTDYRGPIAIHAGLTPVGKDEPVWGMIEIKDEETGEVSTPELDYGKIIGVVELVECIDFTKVHPLNFATKWAEGPWVWVFRNKVALEEPIPMTGGLGLRELHPDFIKSWEELAAYGRGE